MFSFHYCKYYRLKSGSRIILNDDEIVFGPQTSLEGDFEVGVASGCVFKLGNLFPEKVEAEALPPSSKEIQLGLRGEFFVNRTFAVKEPGPCQITR